MGVIMEIPPAPIRGSIEVDEEELSDLVAVSVPVGVSESEESAFVPVVVESVAEAVSAVVAASPVVAASAAVVSVRVSYRPLDYNGDIEILPSCLATIPRRAKCPSSYDQAVTGPSKNSMHSTLRKTKDFIAEPRLNIVLSVPIRCNQWTDGYMEDEMTKGSIDPLGQIQSQARNRNERSVCSKQKESECSFL